MRYDHIEEEQTILAYMQGYIEGKLDRKVTSQNLSEDGYRDILHAKMEGSKITKSELEELYRSEMEEITVNCSSEGKISLVIKLDVAEWFA